MSRGYPSLVLFDFDTYLLSDFYLLLPVNAYDNYDTSIQLLANNKMSNTRLVACWLRAGCVYLNSCEKRWLELKRKLNKESFVRLEICTIMERITYTTGHTDDYSNYSFTNSHSYLA